MIHPLAEAVLVYYKFYPLIYLVVSAYHLYGYYEYGKVIAHYLKLASGKKPPPDPKEEDYEWIVIEDEILDNEEGYFDLHMFVMVNEPEPTTTDIEGEPSYECDTVDIPL